MQKTIAKIHLGAVRKNAAFWKKQSGVRLCAVVKADAYGHGAEEVTLALSGIADCFAVALIEEGIAIRAYACGKDILVFTPVTSEAEGIALAQGGFIASVPSLFSARLLAKISRRLRVRVRVHLKVNTGMNRYGMHPAMLGRVCRFLSKEPYIAVEGLYSHLYECDEQTAKTQRELFLRMERICKRYFPSVVSHLGATYGAMFGKDFAFDMVRVGIGLYGYTPIKSKLPLYKAMTVETKVVDTRSYTFGGAGYGKATSLQKGEKLAVCRAGYADGFLRRKENGTDGYEKGVNNLCMDVHIRKGRQRRGAVIPLLTDADKIGEETGTISYEVLCAATRRAERIYDYDL